MYLLVKINQQNNIAFVCLYFHRQQSTFVINIHIKDLFQGGSPGSSNLVTLKQTK